MNRRGHGAGRSAKGRAIAQGTGLALHQRDVVLPVVADVSTVGQSFMAGDDDVFGGDIHALEIKPGADPMVGQITRRPVAFRLRAVYGKL